ncbi:MAG TPA: GNAT family N-acetyltransferase [Bacillales bacterium]
MLIRYKQSHEKIAMGLLSFVPGEENLKQLRQTMNEYETNDDWRLFLWKEEDDITGIVGIRILDEDTAELQHVSVNPSHRNQGLGKAMVRTLADLLGSREIVPNKRTRDFFEQCGLDEVQ